MRIDEEQYLAHYGVLGMKWGKRKAQPRGAAVKRIDKAKAAIRARKEKHYKEADGESDVYDRVYNQSRKSGLSKAKADKIATKESNKYADNYYKKYNSDLKKLKSDYKQAKKDRKSQIKETYKNVTEKSTIAERLIFNNSVRKKAAKYMVDNDMRMDVARDKANREAIRDTGIILATLGTIKMAELILR